MIRGWYIAVSFLTCLPVPRVRFEGPCLTWALAWFSWVGLLLGASSAAVAFAAASAGLSPLTAAGCAVTFLVVLTRGLHLDGVADVADGLSGGRGDAAVTLEIMRDSRIGAHGAVALCLVIFLKIALVAELVRRGEWWGVGVGPVIGRVVATLLVVSLPYARAHGLGASFRRAARPWSLIVGAVPLVAAAFIWSAWTPALVALGWGAAFGVWMNRRLGGLTGDVYGASVETAEVLWFGALSAAVNA